MSWQPFTAANNAAMVIHALEFISRSSSNSSCLWRDARVASA
jgi:hypothetical protein